MEGPGTVLKALVTTYNRPEMLQRCLSTLYPICDKIQIAYGHIKREVRQNIDESQTARLQTYRVLHLFEQGPPFQGGQKIFLTEHDSESFTDQLNYLLREANVRNGEWFLWICDDEAVLGDGSRLLEAVKYEPRDFVTCWCYGRTGPDNPVLYTRVIKKSHDTEFFPVHWQLIHNHNYIDLYKKQLSSVVYDGFEFWDLEAYPKLVAPSLEEAKAWYNGPKS